MKRRMLILTLGIGLRATAAQTPIPIRALTSVVKTDSGMFAGIPQMRALPDGRLLVNDVGQHRLIVFDTTLAHFTVSADNAGAPNRYGAQPGTFIPYVADSTIMLDVDAQAFVVIDPRGEIARTMAMPRSNFSDIIALVSGARSNQGYDPKGRMIYPALRNGARDMNATDSGTVTTRVLHDSSLIMRLDPDTKQSDTIAYLNLAVSKIVRMTLGPGRYPATGPAAPNPLPVIDDWTLLPDGTIAIVRGHDYHIDWVSPDGVVTPSPKMAYDWRRATTEDKQRMIDSAKAAADARAAAAAAAAAARGANAGAAAAGRAGRAGSSGARGPVTVRLPGTQFEPSELPDYYPPIRAGTVKSDPDGNVWILPTTSSAAGSGLVYDVVNRKGEVVERVRLPEGRALIAVGRGGVVYMGYAPARGVGYLERARIVR